MKTVNLADVCTITMGQAPKGDTYNDRGEGIPLVAGAGDFGELHPEPKKFTTAMGVRRSEPGDIIVGIRASIGDKVLSDGVYCLGRGVAGLRAGPQLDARFLWHWVTQAAPALAAKGRGATFLQVNKHDVSEMQIPLPPIEEQRRIAAVLDAADALRAKRRRSLAALDSLTQAIFMEMFGDSAPGAVSWPVLELSEIVAEGTTVTYGIVQAGEEFQGGVPYIRTGDIVDGVVRTEALRHTAPEIAARFPRSRVSSGEIVMSIRATVGTTALVPAELDGANLTQGTARIAPGAEVETGFLLEHLRSEPAQQWIERQVKGATFREITLTRLRQLPIRVPPLALQKEFQRRSDAVSALRHDLQQALDELESLFSSLQQRAFRGDL